jgi:hypothetical protein
MKDQKESKIENASKKESKKESNKDAKLENASLNIQKNIEEKKSSPSIYLNPEWDSMNDKDKKSYRRKRRSELQKFINDILGKDRSENEIKDSIKSFKSHFKKNYLAKEISPSSLYSGNDINKRNDLESLCKIINK